MHLKALYSCVAYPGASPLLSITAFQCNKKRPLWPVYTSLQPRDIVTACLPLERDLLALGKETFFKDKVEVFTVD